MSMATVSSEDKAHIEIVPFHEADLDEIMAIEDVSFSAPWSRQSYLDLAPLDTISFFVVKQDDRVVGYMLYQTWEEEMELHTIAVDPNHRREGVGRRMLEYLLSDATTRGVERVFLQVRPSNVAARTLYTQFGFYVIGVRHHYYRDNYEDALVMRRDLRRENQSHSSPL